jgi:hypothetical protein
MEFIRFPLLPSTASVGEQGGGGAGGVQYRERGGKGERERGRGEGKGIGGAGRVTENGSLGEFSETVSRLLTTVIRLFISWRYKKSKLIGLTHL